MGQKQKAKWDLLGDEVRPPTSDSLFNQEPHLSTILVPSIAWFSLDQQRAMMIL